MLKRNANQIENCHRPSSLYALALRHLHQFSLGIKSGTISWKHKRSYRHHPGLKRLHTCEAGTGQKWVKGKCQNEVSFVCACAHAFSSVGEQLGVDIKTKSHRCSRLCLLHNKPLALTRHIGFFSPRPAVFEPYRGREKAPGWTRFLCGSISRLLFRPS